MCVKIIHYFSFLSKFYFVLLTPWDLNKVALCLLVSRAPGTCMAPAALQELERARILFRSAKDFCPRAMQVVVSSFSAFLIMNKHTFMFIL